jgi:DNA replication protein DnaC
LRPRRKKKKEIDMHKIGEVLEQRAARTPTDPEWVARYYCTIARKREGAGQTATKSPEQDTVCQTCGGLGWIKSETTDPTDSKFGKLIPCTDCGLVAAQRLKKLEEISGLSEAERQISISDFIARCNDTPGMIEVVKAYADRPCGFLTLWGGPGNGKSVALMSLTNHFRRQGKMSVYVTFVDLLDHIRAGYDRDADENARQRYETICRAYFIAVDEVDKANMTSYAEEFRTRFLDDRYRLGLEMRVHTAFAMNRSPEYTMPPHIYSRLRDGRFVCYENADPDLRPAMTREKTLVGAH